MAILITLHNHTGTGETLHDAMRDAYAKTTAKDNITPGRNFGFAPNDSTIRKWWSVDKEGVIRDTLTKQAVGHVHRDAVYVVLVKKLNGFAVCGPYDKSVSAQEAQKAISFPTEVLELTTPDKL